MVKYRQPINRTYAGITDGTNCLKALKNEYIRTRHIFINCCLLLTKRILIYPKQLLGKIIKEPHIIDKIALEKPTRLFHTTVKPLHAYPLPEQGGALQRAGLEIDGGTESHEKTDTGHTVAVVHYPFLLLGRTYANEQHVRTAIVNDAHKLVTLCRVLLKAIRR